MSQIEELQGRILAAMDRIGAGVRSIDAVQAGSAGREAELARALDEERTANAQLEERLKVLHDRLEDAGKRDGDLKAMEAELALLRNEAGDASERSALQSENQRLKAALADAAGGDAALQSAIADLRHENERLQSELSAAQAAAGRAGDDALLRLDADLRALRDANESLRASNDALRRAAADGGVGDAAMINAAMAAEIEGLRAAQAAEQAQVSAVLSRLEPLLEEARAEEENA